MDEELAVKAAMQDLIRDANQITQDPYLASHVLGGLQQPLITALINVFRLLGFPTEKALHVTISNVLRSFAGMEGVIFRLKYAMMGIELTMTGVITTVIQRQDLTV